MKRENENFTIKSAEKATQSVIKYDNFDRSIPLNFSFRMSHENDCYVWRQ